MKPPDIAPPEPDVEIVWHEDDNARADRRFIELVRGIRDKHRVRLETRNRSRGK